MALRLLVTVTVALIGFCLLAGLVQAQDEDAGEIKYKQELPQANNILSSNSNYP